jgi:hypothetical protein
MLAARNSDRSAWFVGTLLLAVVGCQLFVDLDGLEDKHCSAGEKACPNGGCVRVDDPNTGCSRIGCAPCAPPHAEAMCTITGECMINHCVGDWWDCDGDIKNGCETDLAHAADNCNRCFRECAKPMHGIAGCSERECTIGGCDPGWEDCNHIYADGCEREIWTDAECLCEQPCAEGTHCMRGVCQ